MANQNSNVGKHAAGAVSGEEAVEKVSVEGFADLVVAMSRLLAGFGQLKPLRDGGLGLGEWAALSVFAREAGLTGKLTGRKLGVPVKRVSQISASLEKSGFVSVRQRTEEGKESKVIAITDAGRAKLGSVNAELQVALQGALKARSLKNATRSMKPLGRILLSADPDKANKRKARKEKKLAEGAGAKE
jgi:DNA-binding MarR family transcriptional regulator